MESSRRFPLLRNPENYSHIFIRQVVAFFYNNPELTTTNFRIEETSRRMTKNHQREMFFRQLISDWKQSRDAFQHHYQ